MREMWKRLDSLSDEQSRWIPRELPRSSHWNAHGRSLSARGPGSAAFRGGHESIMDDYLDGYPEELIEWLPAHAGESAENEVGDLRVEGTVRALSGTQTFVVELREGGRHYRFELPGPAATANVRARIDAGPSARSSGALATLGTNTDVIDPPASIEWRLPAGRAVRFAAQNLDDRLTLEIDGEEMLALEIEPAEDQFSSVTLVVDGEGADLDELMVYRDVYYTARAASPIAVPAGCFYMLGDNTQTSSDSREWTLAVFEVTHEDGTVERVRGNWRSTENPRQVASVLPGGPFTYFIDEWGEKHWFRRGEARRQAPELAPFVPREMIQGKALAVFWPLDPFRGIWRLKWVN